METIAAKLMEIVSLHGCVEERLQPGASQSELDDAEKAFGFTFSAPLRELYSCHNGTKSVGTMASCAIWPVARLMSLEESVTIARELLKDNELYGISHDASCEFPRMAAGWFPFLKDLGRSYTLIDMRPESSTYGHILYNTDQQVAASRASHGLADFLDMMRTGYREGIYEFIGETQTFQVDDQRFADLRKRYAQK